MIKAASSQSVHSVVWSQKLNAHEEMLFCPPLQAAVPHALLIYPFSFLQPCLQLSNGLCFLFCGDFLYHWAATSLMLK